MYDILSITCILNSMTEKEQQCVEIIDRKKCLYFIINEVEKDMDKSYFYDVLCLQRSNSLIFNSRCFFPLNYDENEYFFKNIIVDNGRIAQIFIETKIQPESNLWVKIRKDKILASFRAHKIKSCKNVSDQIQEKLAISLLSNKDLAYTGKIIITYCKKFKNIALYFYSKKFNVLILNCGVIHFQIT